MKMQLRQEDILQLFVSNEELISQLYAIFAEKFPAHAGFWNGLAREEKKHADSFRTLIERASGGAYYFDESLFDTAAIESFSRYIQELLIRASVGSFNIHSATVAALDIEGALLERQVFDQFQGTDTVCKQTLQNIKEDCSKHFEQIKEFRNTLAPIQVRS